MQPGYPGYPQQPGYGYGYGYAPMPPQRPSAPRTFGILSMIFSGFVALSSLFSLATGGGQLGAMNNPPPGQKEAFEHLMHAIRTPSMIGATMFLVMSVWLFVIGTGQRTYKRWAVKQSVIWSVVALVALVGYFIMQMTMVLPALNQFAQEIAHDEIAKPIANLMKVMLFVGSALYAPYPLVLLFNFRKPHIVQAMDQPPQATPAAAVF
jgi:hypothetical protein